MWDHPYAADIRGVTPLVGPITGGGSTRRLFVVYALVSAVPVLLLGAGLLSLLHRQATDRGLAEGANEARLVAQATVAPLLDGHPLSGGLRPRETTELRRTVALAVAGGQVIRLRVRDLSARVVYASDGACMGTVDE